MRRLRLLDLRNSRAANAVNLCVADLPRIAEYANSAQRRLILAGENGDEGWWGTWAEMAFTVSRLNPFITCPPEVARLEELAVCKKPVVIQNQFYEYLQFGSGPKPNCRWPGWPFRQAYSRNNVVTFDDLVGTKIIRIYPADALDADGLKRVLLQGLDANGNVVRTFDGENQVDGIFITLETPFADCPIPMSQITGIQKDQTFDKLTFFQVDMSTGAEANLSFMQPAEETASYRRYYIDQLPCNCCNLPSTATTVQVTAMAKLDPVDVRIDSDYFVLQNLEAITEEIQSIRYSTMDIPAAKQMAQEKHAQAIRLLNGELVHFLGKEHPAIQFAPFGSARLEWSRVGIMQ
ncbi:MAG TPA: hypothetical protein VF077_12985 [Nitrospiraceae bacterium]